jgi:uncharacterized protein (TIGR02466 family)
MSDSVQTKINVNSPFGIPIYEVQLENFSEHQKALKSTILEMRKEDIGTKVSNQGGWHSNTQLHRSDNAEIRWLIGEIQKASMSCIRHSKTAPEGARFGLAACWANVNESGDWNAPHAHFPADWSGVCYVQVNRKSAEMVKSDKDGDILLFNPLPIGPQYQRPPTISRRPHDGHILLFPSYLVHMVAPHFESDPRISVAFNFRLAPNRKNPAEA